MKPETVGMSSARLARLDEVMKRRYVDGGYLPGMLTYVYRKGHLVHTSPPLVAHDMREGCRSSKARQNIVCGTGLPISTRVQLSPPSRLCKRVPASLWKPAPAATHRWRGLPGTSLMSRQ